VTTPEELVRLLTMARPAKKRSPDGSIGTSIYDPARVDASRLRGDRWPGVFGSGATIGECVDTYHKEHRHRRPEWTYSIQKNINEYLYFFDMDEGHPIHRLTKESFKRFKQALLDGHVGKPTKRKITPATIAQKLQSLHHFTKWLVNNDYLPADPMAGVTLPPRLVANSKVHKEGFTDEQLAKIFQGLAPYRNSADPMRVEWYWITLLLAHSGCRAMEVIQQHKSDVQEIDGVWCMSISDQSPGQRLKNRPSKRIVPIHSAVLNAGFLDWWKDRPDGQLYPLVKPYGAQKTSDWTTYLLIKLKIKRPELTQHSFRHAVTIKLERARVHYSLMRRLLGHAVGKSVEDRVYLGSLQYSAKELQEAIEALRYPAIP
jgi:integrase